MTRVRVYAFAFAGCMFGVAGLAQFIRPGGWAVWVALGLLAVALVLLALVDKEAR